MLEFTTENTGARVVINVASMRQVTNLKNVILKEIIKNPLGLKLQETTETKTALEKEIDISGLLDYLKNTIIEIETSEDFNKAVFDCLGKCTYDMKRIIPELFDDIPEARADYYEIVFRCIEENLRPFIKSLASKWKTLAPKIGENPLLNQLLAQMNK